MLITRCSTLLVLVSYFLISVSAPASATPATAEVAERVEVLLKKMTLQEKIGQLNQYSSTFDVTGPPPEDGAGLRRYEQIRTGQVGSMLNVLGADATRKAQALAVENSRLGIPMLFGYDVIHGYRTIFPVPLGETASWDLTTIEATARVAAIEAAAAGIHWTFAPMVDISRDARWGRIMEGAGEDPYLGARVAAARVHGFQGSDLAANDTIAACAKHFAAYGLAEAGRDYNVVDISMDTLHNVVLPPFRAAVDAGVLTVMNSFNEIGGTPATANSYLQRDLLKGQWGFDGFVVSDWGSIGELVPHGIAEDLEHAATQAIHAGSDMDMESSAYVTHLSALVESGEVDEALIDDAVRRILRVKFLLGLFEDPYRYSDSERESRLVSADEHHELARVAARKSIVLLKNDGPLLPLAKKSGTLAVIGPLAADKDSPLGSWRGTGVSDSAVSLLEGIEAAVGDKIEIQYAKGVDLGMGERSFIRELQINEDDTSGIAGAVALARNADRVVLALGEEAFQSGEGRSQAGIGLRGVQQQLLEAVLKANPRTVVVLMNGRPLEISWMAEHAPAILETWHLGSQAGHAIADVLFGDYNPGGKLPVSFPRHVGQEPLYYNHRSTGRPARGDDLVFWSHYTDIPNTPLFPFGFGLSYTTFEFSDLELSAETVGRDDRLEVAVTVRNTGQRTGVEVVQFYVRDLIGSVTRPILELKGFERIELEPGGVERVLFSIGVEDLAFYTAAKRWETESGVFEVSVGNSSVNRQSARFTLE